MGKKSEISEASDSESGVKRKKNKSSASEKKKKRKSNLNSEDSEGEKKKKKKKSLASASDDGEKKKKKKSLASASDDGEKKKKKKSLVSASEDGEKKKKKKKKKKDSDSDSELSDIPPMREIDRLRKSQYIREEKLVKLRMENAPPEEQYKEMFAENYEDHIDDLEREIKELKKTLEKQKKKGKLPPEAKLQIENDWLKIQIKEWTFKNETLDSKFELIKKAHQNTVNSLQEAQVMMVNKAELDEMREYLKNKKNDLYEATSLIKELQKVAWSMLPPKVGKHCQGVEVKMEQYRNQLDHIFYEMYKIKMEYSSTKKEVTALSTAIEGESELKSILENKIITKKKEMDSFIKKKEEYETTIANGMGIIESAGITYDEALKIQATIPQPPPPSEEVSETKSKSKKPKKKKKTSDEDDETADVKGVNKWEEKSKFLDEKLKQITGEIVVAKKELEKVEKDQKSKLSEIKKMEDIKKQITALNNDKGKLGVQLQQEIVLRKTYYNQIEDLKGKIRVFSRCRPISGTELQRGNVQCVSFPDKYTVAVHGVSKDGKAKEFQFDRVFPPNTEQIDVFEDTSRLIQSAFDGFNVCIFAYGQTGSGKTFTLIGNVQNAPGIAPRAFVRIFEVVEEGKAKFTANLTCYMLELYNEKLLDLLSNGAEYTDKLEIKKDQHGMVVVPGSEVLPARNSDELRDIFLRGNGNRHIASTKMNSESSRSHLIISILIESVQASNGKIIRGKMSIIDLAGSERLAKSGVKGVGATEATAINMSLSALGDVISALTSGQPFVPYRNNKLTMLMQDSLGGNAKTLMFVNLSPVDYNATETVNSLTYAQRVKLIKNDAIKVADTDEIPKLQAILDRLHNGEHIEDLQAAMG